MVRDLTTICPVFGAIGRMVQHNQAYTQLHWCLDFDDNMVAENNLDRYFGSFEMALVELAMRQS